MVITQLGGHNGLLSILSLKPVEGLGQHELESRLALLSRLDGLDQLGQGTIVNGSENVGPNGDRLHVGIEGLNILEGERTLDRKRHRHGRTARLTLGGGGGGGVDVNSDVLHMLFIYYSFSLPANLPLSTPFFNFLR